MNDHYSLNNLVPGNSIPVPKPVMQPAPAVEEEFIISDEPVIVKVEPNSPKNYETFKSPFTPDDPDAITELLALPSLMRRDFLEHLALVRQASIETNDDKRWLGVASAANSDAPNVVRSGAKGIPEEDLFAEALESTARKWVQRIVTDNGPITARVPNIVPKGGTLTGKKAVQYARNKLGMSTYFAVPLWHTGGFMQFVSPSESAFIQLMGRISDQAEELGRRTNGMYLAQEVAYLLEIYLDFALQHLDESTIQFSDFNDLKSKINIHDIPAIIWGVAGAFWSRGFRYMRACMTDHTKCRHVITEMVDLRRLQYVDSTSMTKWQIDQVMSIRSKESINDEMLKRFREESVRMKPVTYKLAEDVSVEMDLCSATVYFNSARKWITGIEEKYVEGMGYDGEERRDTMVEHAKSSGLRQYAHLVKKLTVGDVDFLDADTIEEVLANFSSDDKITREFFKSVSRHLTTTVVSVIGIPTYKCPECGSEQMPANPLKSHPGIIPLNVARLFFYLHPQRLKIIERR